ncbi:uncharacterized protein LOC123657186 [Melitaea cinxia]|uniref:uncharacterized protein LOC123657186 n=1 Tax=Melitaea cinxia TaxID=113334 RepID=UPI001E2733C4|nr:uncharacterized protein LOC123657186 [Melitaea cinxia]
MRTGFPDTNGSSNGADDLRKTALIDVELKRLNIAVSALQETRLPDEGSIREASYTFFWKGRDSTAAREHGVGFAIRNDLLSAMETPRGISERIMVLRMRSNCGFVTFISAYAPTLVSPDEAKDQFYDQLTETVRGVSSSDRLYILGDFNARVGQDSSAWPDCVGPHGIGKLNENGQRLLEFCSSQLLCVTNTFFKGKPMRRVSWKHPRSGHWHQLDLVLTRRKDLRETIHTRTFHSAECDTDHSLVVTRVALIHKKIHSSKPPGKKKLDLPKTRHDDLIRDFEDLVRKETETWNVNATVEDEWSNVRTLLTETAAKAFGYQRAKSQDWFTENIEQLSPLLDSKRDAALAHRLNPNPKTREELTISKAALQRSTRHFANVYWTNICHNIQACADSGNFSGVYSGIKQAIGPVSKKTAPLKEADGSVITDRHRQMERWVEHFTTLYATPVSIEPEAVQSMPKLDTWSQLDDLPTIREYHIAVKQLKRGKSPGSDGTQAEILKLKCVSPILHSLLCKCWEAGCVPRDMRDANIITLYKGKGDRGDCNSYRGISLLSSVGKLFGRVILGKLQKLANRVYPEAQCGFRPRRSTVDMIFSLRQLQEKCREQKTPLYVAFVDLNKAFDTVSREGLYTALKCIGCPPKLLSLVQSFHEDMKGAVVFDGQTSDRFEMRRGVRQGCVLAPTLFGIFFSIILRTAFGDSQQGIHLHTRVDGKLFNISLLQAKQKRHDLFVDSLLFADDAAFVANSVLELQTIMDKFSKACTLFSMSINPKKTVVLAQGSAEIPAIMLDSTALQVVDRFCYLGSTVSNNLSLEAEINTRIGKAATTFGRLSTRVWNNKHLTNRTKMIVFQACVLSTLLYGAETWTSYAKQERQINTFYMRCLRNILGISWKDRATNERVLQIARMPSLTAMLKQRRLRWLGHVHRMDPSRLPRQIMLGAVANARRDVGRPLLRFKDCAKRDMVAFNINHNSWEKLAENRDQWRKSVKDGQQHHDEAWFGLLSDRRNKKHQNSDISDTSTSFPCSVCGRICRSRIGLYSHQKKCSSDTA